jgi:predicted dehydrogenase
MRAVIGRDATMVDCRTWLPAESPFSGPMTGVALVDFEGGVMVRYRGSFASVREETAWSGEWRMEFDRGEVRWACRAVPDTVRLMTRDGTDQQVRLPTVLRCDRSGSITEFVSAVRDGRRPETAGRDNLDSFGICRAAIESAHTRAPVALATIGQIDGRAVDGKER